MAENRASTTELGTSEARKRLPGLVRKAAARNKPAKRLKDRAVKIKVRGGERSASLVPTIDLDAAEERIAALEEDLENAGIALFLQDRLAQTNGERLSAEQFLREIGMDGFIGELPER